MNKPAVVQQGQWVTASGCKSILVVIHTLTYAQRLREVFSLVRGDRRIQVVFALAPHAFSDGAGDYLRARGITVIPWELAVRSEFDLALAAGSRGIEQVRAPLIRLSHGAGQIKLLRTPTGPGPAELPRTPGMVSRQHLMSDGRVIPAAVAFAHDEDLAQLAVGCPEALPVATVVGDPCHDRIVASLARREEYRRALGLTQGQRLVVVPSTWGPSSAFGKLETLLPRLLAELPPDEYRVAALLHPNVWSGHGGWQVRGWLSGCLRRGLALVPPESDWQGLLIAADRIIGDHGSVTAYGALTGAPILLACYPHTEVSTTSPAALLAAASCALDPVHPLREQLDFAAAERRPQDYARVCARLSSAPGDFARRMRKLIYRLLELGEPAYAAETEPVPLPAPLDSCGERDWGVPA
ncbi:hypothetical protein LHJ74_14000 [Streptomyces sp. N2-109]|uniref:Uncharacterized protein n=1 Tax=Streptomyces gossypii TaxID=2883101 RepID=A0ABT2JUP2_9ACTN|nr:hypothetical protein [Streptomyces gossypii]MCT2591009.1 hypothetical protein [Streptomyces gossypii]